MQSFETGLKKFLFKFCFKLWFKEKEEEEENRAAEDEKRPGRDRVREMIAAAHREASIGNGDEGDDVMVGRKLRESKTISEEMSKLAMEEARLEYLAS